MAVQKYKAGSPSVLIGTELNGLASGANALGPAFTNSQGQPSDGSLLCDLEGVFTFAGTPAAGSAIELYLLGSQDGVNFEDGSATITPQRAPEAVFPLRNVTGTQRVIRRLALPAGVLRPLLRNAATGQTLAATDNTVNIRPITYETV